MFLISEIRKNTNRTDVTFVTTSYRSIVQRGTAKQKVWGEVMFYTCLSLCSQGERGWYDVTSCYGQHPLGQHHLLDSTTPWTALLPGQHHPLNSTSPPTAPPSIPANKRAVRILLECFLVKTKLQWKTALHHKNHGGSDRPRTSDSS